MRRLFALLAFGSALTLSAGLQAAPLNQSDVGNNAKWLLHIDFDAAHASKIGEDMRSHMLEHEGVKKAIEKIKTDLGMQLPQDLHGVTLYGSELKPHTGVMIIYAKADKDKVMAKLKAKPDFKSVKDGSYEIYSFTENHHGHHGQHGPNAAKDGKPTAKPAAKSESKPATKPDGKSAAKPEKGAGEHHGHTVYVCFPKEGVAVVSASESDLKAALAVIGGKGGLATGSPLLGEVPKGTVIRLAVTGLAGVKMPTHMPLAKKLEQVNYAAGESDGNAFSDLTLGLADDATATQLKAIGEGLVAMGDLRLGDHLDAKKLLDEVKFEAKGKTFGADWKGSAADIIKIGDKIREDDRAPQSAREIRRIARQNSQKWPGPRASLGPDDVRPSRQARRCRGQ